MGPNGSYSIYLYAWSLLCFQSGSGGSSYFARSTLRLSLVQSELQANQASAANQEMLNFKLHTTRGGVWKKT